jgi:hypothetical protein
MKKQHLTNEQATRLSNYNLTGSALFEALEHIEDCEVCRLKVPQVTSETVLQRLSATDLRPLAAEIPNASNRNARFGQYWGLGFAACLIGLSVGLYYFIAGTSKNDSAVNKNVVNQPTEIDSNDANEQVTSEIGKEEKAEIDNNSLPENESVPKQKLSKLTTESAKNKVPEIIRQKQTTNIKSKNVNEHIELSSKNTSNERSDLERFLIRIPASILSLRPNFGNVRGGNDDSQVPTGLSPNGEVIRETQPNLSWNKAKDAKAYQVSLADKNYRQVLSEKAVENNLQVKKSLKRGQTYIFTVTAEKENLDDSNQTPTQPAIFRIASEKVVTKLERAEKNGKDWNILSVLIKEGLLGEAEKKLNLILGKNPKDRLATKLLDRVKKLRLVSENLRLKQSPTNNTDD